MRRYDKKQNIFEANLRLERDFIITKNKVLLSTTDNVFIESCLSSNYFNNDEKTFILETVLPNQNLIQEGGWDWIKDNIIEPTKGAVKKGIESAKTFWTKIKQLITNIGNFLKEVWVHIKKFGSWLWDKVIGIVEGLMDKHKDRITKHLEKFKNVPPKDRDTEVEQLGLTTDFWLTKGGIGPLFSKFEGDVGKSISSVDSSNEGLMECWSSDVIDFFSNTKNLIKEGGSKVVVLIDKIAKIIGWVLKIPIKALEVVLSKVTQGALVAVSYFTNLVGGPGTFKFKNLSHLLAAILVTIMEAVVLASHTFHSDFGGNFITNTINGWESHISDMLGPFAGQFVGPLITCISVVGISIGLYETVRAIQHMKNDIDKSQYDKQDLDMDGDVDSDDRMSQKTKDSDEYYGQPTT